MQTNLRALLLEEQEQLEEQLLVELSRENRLGHRNLRILDLRDPYSNRQSSRAMNLIYLLRMNSTQK